MISGAGLWFDVSSLFAGLAPEAALRAARGAYLRACADIGQPDPVGSSAAASRQRVTEWVNGAEGRDALDAFNKKYELGHYNTSATPALPYLLGGDVLNCRADYDPFDHAARDYQARQEVQQAGQGTLDAMRTAREQRSSARIVDAAVGFHDRVKAALAPLNIGGNLDAIATVATAVLVGTGVGLTARIAGVRPRAAFPLAAGSGALAYVLTRRTNP